MSRDPARGARRVLRYPWLAVNAAWAALALVAFRVVRPWRRYRVGTLMAERIGHFVGDSAIYLAEQSLQPGGERTTDLFWYDEPSSNAQWSRMVKRKLRVTRAAKYLVGVGERVPAIAAEPLPSTHGTRDTEGLLTRSDAKFDFTDVEMAKAEEWLTSRGWHRGEPFICLLVRDSAYLAEGVTGSKRPKEYWSYHDYRDSDISRYREAVANAIASGFWVVRMGKVAHQRFPAEDAKIIDYPFAADQDDLLDVWLAANCHFFVSTGTGIDTIALAFRRPVAFVDFGPLSHFWTFADNVCAPKRLRWKSSGTLLTLRESLDHGYVSSQDYERAGIVVESLSAADIADTIRELTDRLNGTWVDSPAGEARQSAFRRILREWSGYSQLHGVMHPEARLASRWLESMGDAFLA